MFLAKRKQITCRLIPLFRVRQIGANRLLRADFMRLRSHRMLERASKRRAVLYISLVEAIWHFFHILWYLWHWFFNCESRLIWQMFQFQFLILNGVFRHYSQHSKISQSRAISFQRPKCRLPEAELTDMSKILEYFHRIKVYFVNQVQLPWSSLIFRPFL